MGLPETGSGGCLATVGRIEKAWGLRLETDRKKIKFIQNYRFLLSYTCSFDLYRF